MKQVFSIPLRTRAEEEAEKESNRLIEQIEGALAAVAGRSPEEADALDAFADKIERAARDLAFTFRELAQARRSSEDRA